jgi:hypothetical protein
MNKLEILLTIFIISSALLIGASILKIQNDATVKLCGIEYVDCINKNMLLNESCNSLKLGTCPNVSGLI